MWLARITTATPRGTFHLGLGARRRGHHVDGRATVPRRERSRLVHTVRQDGACAARLGVPSALRSARLAAARSCPRSAPSGPASPCLSKKQLRVGAARWLCSGYRPEGYARLGSYDRGLLTPARCADVPPPAREAGHTARGERAKTLNSARWPAVMTLKHAAQRSDDAVASHRAADGDGPSIEAARTHAHATSRGAGAAVSCVRPIPEGPRVSDS
eukprot:COSAG06_NODE_2021_length_7833_cov_3.800233_3_plen_215_part_00